MAITKMEEVIEVSVTGVGQANRDLDNLDKAQDRAEKSGGKLGKGASKNRKVFDDMRQNVIALATSTMALEVAFKAAHAGMKLLKKPVDFAVNFERQFALIRTLSKDVTPQLKNDLLDLAKQLPFSAGQVSQAAYDAISNNIKPGNVVEFLRAASNAAVGSGAELADTVKVLTAGVNSFGRQGETAASIADKLQATIKLGAINGQEMANIFGNVAPMASYGVALEDYMGALAALTQQGVKPEQAVVQLNNVIKALTAEAGVSKKALSDMGIESGVAAMQSKGLATMLQEVQVATGGQTEKIAKLTNETRAMKGFLGLFKDMDDVQARMEGVGDSTGESVEAAKIMGETAHGAWKEFDSALEAVQTKMGDEIMPILVDTLKRLTKYLNENSKVLAGKFKEALDTLLSFGRFIIDNGSTIIRIVQGIFVGRIVTKFARAISAARAEMVRMGTTSFAGGIAKGLRSAPGIGIIMAAVVPIGGMIADYISNKMEEEIRRREGFAAQRLQRLKDEAQKDAEEHGFSSVKVMHAKKGALAEGKALLLTRDGGVTEENIIAWKSWERMNVEKARKLLEDNKEWAEDARDTYARMESVSLQLQKTFKVAGQAFFQANDPNAIERKEGAEGIISRSGLTEDSVREMAYERFTQKGKLYRTDLDSYTQNNLRSLSITSAGRALAEERIKGLKRLEPIMKKRESVKNAKLAATEAMKEEQAEKRAEILSKRAEERERKIAAKKEAREKKRRQARWRTERKRIKSAELSFQRMAEDEVLEKIEDPEIKGLAKELKSQERQLARVPKGAETSALEFAFAAKIERMQQKFASDREKQSSDEALEEELKQARKLESKREMTARVAELDGDPVEAELLRLQSVHAQEIEQFQEHGLNTLELERRLADERVKIREQMAQQQVAIENQIGGEIAQSIGSTIDAMSAVGQALGASEAWVGRFEALSILARGTYHFFMGGAELANAASSLASGNPLKATAHKVASFMHYTTAAGSAIHAAKAWSGSGGGGGSAVTGAGGGSIPNARLQEDRAGIRDRDERPAIQFGDIILADVPVMMSREGQRAIGRAVAGEVAQELGRRANVRGTARLPERAMRR